MRQMVVERVSRCVPSSHGVRRLMISWFKSGNAVWSISVYLRLKELLRQVVDVLMKHMSQMVVERVNRCVPSSHGGGRLMLSWFKSGKAVWSISVYLRLKELQGQVVDVLMNHMSQMVVERDNRCVPNSLGVGRLMLSWFKSGYAVWYISVYLRLKEFRG